jgi:hypothetical protein
MLYLKRKLCVIIVLYGSRDWIFLQEYFFLNSAKFIRQPTAQEVLEGAKKKIHTSRVTKRPKAQTPFDCLCSWFLEMRLFCEIFRYLVLIEYENFTDLSLKCYL